MSPIITAKYFAEAVDLTNRGEIENFLAERFKISEKPFSDRLNFYTDLMTVLCGKDKILVTKTKRDLKKMQANFDAVAIQSLLLPESDYQATA